MKPPAGWVLQLRHTFQPPSRHAMIGPPISAANRKLVTRGSFFLIVSEQPRFYRIGGKLCHYLQLGPKRGFIFRSWGPLLGPHFFSGGKSRVYREPVGTLRWHSRLSSIGGNLRRSRASRLRNCLCRVMGLFTTLPDGPFYIGQLVASFRQAIRQETACLIVRRLSSVARLSL